MRQIYAGNPREKDLLSSLFFFGMWNNRREGSCQEEEGREEALENFLHQIYFDNALLTFIKLNAHSNDNSHPQSGLNQIQIQIGIRVKTLIRSQSKMAPTLGDINFHEKNSGLLHLAPPYFLSF